MPNEQRIRQIVREELARSKDSSRFQLNSIPQHVHNGVDSPQIKAENVIPATSVTGTITIDQTTTYTLNLNSTFTPQRVTVDGVLTGTYSGNAARVHVVGSAILTPTFYFEENRTPTQAVADTVIDTLDLQFPFNGKPAQESSFLWVTRGGTSNFFAGTSRDHLVSVFFGTSSSDSDDVARVTLTQFSRSSLTLEVPILSSGWEIFLNVNVS